MHINIMNLFKIVLLGLLLVIYVSMMSVSIGVHASVCVCVCIEDNFQESALSACHSCGFQGLTSGY